MNEHSISAAVRRRVRQLLPAVRDRERGQGQRHARTGSHRGQSQERPQQQGPQQILLQGRPEGGRGKFREADLGIFNSKIDWNNLSPKAHGFEKSLISVTFREPPEGADMNIFSRNDAISFHTDFTAVRNRKVGKKVRINC